jgi:small-conductance mechanosensitive channel
MTLPPSTYWENAVAYEFLGNSLSDWTLALTIALAVTAALFMLKRTLVRRLSELAARTSTHFDDIAVAMIGSTRGLALLVIGLYAGSTVLEMSGQMQLFLSRLAIATALVQAAMWGDAGVRGWLARYRARSGADPAKATSTAALGFIARIVLWSVVVLMILDNLGFNITTLVASLGIGGIAVALAVQNILGDLFSSLSIVMDKPFVIGDTILVDGTLGTVEYVGLKTTRVRALGGEQVIFSNTDLLNSRIHNLRRMETRRVVFTIGVTYGTPGDLLRSIPELIGDIIRSQAQVRFDRAHFSKFNASSLDFEVVYIVDTADYAVHMDVQQEIFLRLYECFTERGIEFAFPTQTLHLVGAPEAVPARQGDGASPDFPRQALKTVAEQNPTRLAESSGRGRTG